MTEEADESVNKESHFMSVWVKCEPVNGENSELSDEEIAPVEK